jgi:hypothetical protein
LGLCAVLAAGAAWAQTPVEMKPGLWEMRILKMEQDGKDMLAQMRQAVAGIPPEQRKKMGMAGDGITSRICFSAAMVKEENWLAGQNAHKPDCAPPKISRSSDSLATFEVTCKDMTSKGVYVVTSDQVNLKTDTVMTAGGGKHTMTQESQMKFIGSDCGDIKPLDQMVKEMQAGAAGPQGKPPKK